MAFKSTLAIMLLCIAVSLAKKAKDEDVAAPPAPMESDEAEVDPEKLDYAKGSVCGYCPYCKVSTIIDTFFVSFPVLSSILDFMQIEKKICMFSNFGCIPLHYERLQDWR